MVFAKYIRATIFLIALFLTTLTVHAQSSRDSKSEKDTKYSGAEFSQNKTMSKKSRKKYKSKNGKSAGIIEYEKLRKQVQKEHTKKEKGMRKPQYSDPSYFGHKRPPKKRKNGKKKFCKECGISH